MDEQPSEHNASQTAEAVADVLAKAATPFRSVWVLVSSVLYVLLRRLPKTSGVADGFLNAGHKMKLKATGADVIVNVIYPDGVVVPRAGWWQSDEAAYLTDNGEKFHANGVGFDPKRVNGKWPVIWALREGAEIVEPLEAYIGSQRRLGNWREYARSDGGQDVAVDAFTPGAQGRALSFRDGWRLFGSKITQEDMNLQSQRAKLAELDRQADMGMKLVLVGAGGLALGMFGPALAAKIAGGASGALSGGIPLGSVLPLAGAVLGVF